MSANDLKNSSWAVVRETCYVTQERVREYLIPVAADFDPTNQSDVDNLDFDELSDDAEDADIDFENGDYSQVDIGPEFEVLRLANTKDLETIEKIEVEEGN